MIADLLFVPVCYSFHIHTLGRTVQSPISQMRFTIPDFYRKLPVCG